MCVYTIQGFEHDRSHQKTTARWKGSQGELDIGDLRVLFALMKCFLVQSEDFISNLTKQRGTNCAQYAYSQVTNPYPPAAHTLCFHSYNLILVCTNWKTNTTLNKGPVTIEQFVGCAESAVLILNKH